MGVCDLQIVLCSSCTCCPANSAADKSPCKQSSRYITEELYCAAAGHVTLRVTLLAGHHGVASTAVIELGHAGMLHQAGQ